MKVIDGSKIAVAPKRAGLTQYDLAALARCTQAAISGLDTGNARAAARTWRSRFASGSIETRNRP